MMSGPPIIENPGEPRAAAFADWARRSYMRPIVFLDRFYRTFIDARLAPLGISMSHVALLAHLWEGHSGDTQNAIAVEIDVDKATVSRCANYLEAKGLITRSTSARDGRAQTLSLTQAGWDLAEPVGDVMQEWTDAITADMDESERRHVHEQLYVLLARAEQILRADGLRGADDYSPTGRAPGINGTSDGR